MLGRTGRNFAAGMSGGVAYIYDEEKEFSSVCNTEMVDLDPLTDPEEIEELHQLIQMHHEATGSVQARSLLSTWESTVRSFVKVFPQDYKKVLQEAKALKVATQAIQNAVLPIKKKQEPKVLDIEDSSVDIKGLEM